MDVLIGLLILIALALVMSRPFRQRSKRDEEIYRRVSGLDGDDGEGRIPCPACGELILPTAQVCRFCGREVKPGDK